MPSKIRRIQIKNLKAITEADVTFNGCTAIVTGGNDKGKSTFIKSLMDRLRGMKPDHVLRQGTNEGFYEMELTTGEKFSWKFDTKKEKLTFISEKNIPGSLTKEIRSYYFPVVFDVDKFLNDPPAVQKKALEKIAGVDFDDLNKELAEARETRTFQNKLVEVERARQETVIESLPKVPEPFEKLQDEFNSIQAHNEKINGFGLRLKEKQNQLDNLKKQIAELETAVNAGAGWLAHPQNQPKDNNYINNLSKKIIDIKTKNKAIEENNKAIEQNKIFEKALKNAETAEKDVKRIEADKLDAIKKAHNLPEGFGFTEDGITYNGYPFDRQSLSTSAIYIAALKLAAVGLGEVKTLHFDASYLDRSHLEQIEEWATAQGLQLLIERPDFEGGDIEYQIMESKA